MNSQGVPLVATVEAMLLEPVLAPLFEGCDVAGQYEAGEFAREIVKQLAVRG